jgi:putative transposase
MARIARFVIPDIPHHVTQRDNRREQVFFSNIDYAAYLNLLRTYAAQSQTEIWSWCLMPNHVHLIAVRSHPDGLRAMLGEVHRRHTKRHQSA